MGEIGTIGSVGIWILAAGCAAAAVWVGLQLFHARARLNHLRMLMAESAESAQKLVDQTGRDLSVIRNSLRKMKGEKIFVPEMTMKEVFDADPRVHRFLAKHRRSGVIRMEFESGKSLRQTAEEYDLDLEGLLSDLNGLE